MIKSVLVIGGGGYVGSALVPALLNSGYAVTVLDTFWYGTEQFKKLRGERLKLIHGDMRDRSALRHAMAAQDACIHLACISNDPSFELNPELGKSINYDSFAGVLDSLRESQVKRFIYASSSSVYGVKEENNVTEQSTCEPITDYSRFKLLCERDLQSADLPLVCTIVRPATVCGFAPRLRLDLVVNILTMSGLLNKRIMVNGGNQLRPNLNIKDMVAAYLALLVAPKELVDREIFNVGFENMNLMEIARMVKTTLNDLDLEIERVPSSDNRSYHVNSDKIAQTIGFKPRFTIGQAISSLVIANLEGKIRNAMSNPLYYNIRMMQELKIT